MGSGLFELPLLADLKVVRLYGLLDLMDQRDRLSEATEGVLML